MAEKTILNAGTTDPNKILPIKYHFARTHYKNGVNNNWTPDEVNMQKDFETWKDKDGLSDDERRLIMWNMGFFSTAESLTANNIVLTIYKHVTSTYCDKPMKKLCTLILSFIVVTPWGLIQMRCI